MSRSLIAFLVVVALVGALVAVQLTRALPHQTITPTHLAAFVVPGEADLPWPTSGQAAVSNFINDLQPADRSAVAPQLTVTGKTMPNARVIVQLGTIGDQTNPNDVIGQILGIGNNGNRGNAVRVETNADGNGIFQTQVNIGAQPGQRLGLVVDSTDPRTQASARARRVLTVR